MSYRPFSEWLLWLSVPLVSLAVPGLTHSSTGKTTAIPFTGGRGNTTGGETFSEGKIRPGDRLERPRKSAPPTSDGIPTKRRTPPAAQPSSDGTHTKRRTLPAAQPSSGGTPTKRRTPPAAQPTYHGAPTEQRSRPSEKSDKFELIGGEEFSFSVGGYVGHWGNMSNLGVRGVMFFTDYLSVRLNISLLFATDRENPFTFSCFSLALQIYLPSMLPSVRYYSVTRLDIWPMWDLFNTNPSLSSISDRPSFGLSLLLGGEAFLLPNLSLFLEVGFSSGIMLGLSQIKSQFEAFGFVMFSGFNFYF